MQHWHAHVRGCTTGERKTLVYSTCIIYIYIHKHGYVQGQTNTTDSIIMSWCIDSLVIICNPRNCRHPIYIYIYESFFSCKDCFHVKAKWKYWNRWVTPATRLLQFQSICACWAIYLNIACHSFAWGNVACKLMMNNTLIGLLSMYSLSNSTQLTSSTYCLGSQQPSPKIRE